MAGDVHATRVRRDRHLVTGSRLHPPESPWVHGSRLGRAHGSVRQHLVEDHDQSPAAAAALSDGSVHGLHDKFHRATWAYSLDLPHGQDVD